MKKKFVMTITAGTWLAFSALAGAQSAGAPPAAASAKDQHVISTQDPDMLRQDIRSHKKQLIAQNLSLTDTDATKFWPIYDKYTAELAKINDKEIAGDPLGHAFGRSERGIDQAVPGSGHPGRAATGEVPAHRGTGHRRS